MVQFVSGNPPHQSQTYSGLAEVSRTSRLRGRNLWLAPMGVSSSPDGDESGKLDKWIVLMLFPDASLDS